MPSSRFFREPQLLEPTEPLLREEQLRELEACIAGVLADARPVHAWVHGPPGAGKTLCVRHLLRRASAKGVLPVFVNCREQFTMLGVIEHVLNVVKPLRSPVRTRERQLRYLRAELTDRRAVIALDEVDVLKEQDLAELLHQLCSLPRSSLICVAGSRQALLSLPEAAKSRLAPRQVLFPRYRPEELTAILQYAATQALASESWAAETLGVVAEHAYGDARRALALLRHAVQRAEEEGASRVLPGHVVPANREHFNPTVDEQLALLSPHYRLLYELASAKGPIPALDLEAKYRRLCAQRELAAVSERGINTYLRRLCDLKLLERERGAGTRGWIYRVARGPSWD